MEKFFSLPCVAEYEYTRNVDSHPFGFCDRPLPACNTGVVYILIRTKNYNYTFIEITNNIKKSIEPTQFRYWIIFHNNGKSTTLALFAYIIGFDGNRRTIYYVEQTWKSIRQYEFTSSMMNPKEIARLGY